MITLPAIILALSSAVSELPPEPCRSCTADPQPHSSSAPGIAPSRGAGDFDEAPVGTNAQVDEAAICTPDFSDARDDHFYALDLDRETFVAIATASPVVAELLLALRTRERMPPLKLHDGDGTFERLPTTKSVLRAFDHGPEDDSVEPLTRTLSPGEFIALEYDVERFDDGTAVLTISSALRQLGSRSGEPIDERFRVLLRATGDTRPIGQIEGVFADVYDVIGFEASARGI